MNRPGCSGIRFSLFRCTLFPLSRALLAVAVIAGVSEAQTTRPVARQPVVTGQNVTAQRPTTNPAAAATESDCHTPAVLTAAQLTPSPTGPHPKLVCKQTVVKADPIWRGKSANFEFEIANEGEADLNIKIKGG